MTTKSGKSVGKSVEKLQDLGYEGATTAMQGKTLFDPKAKTVDVTFAKSTIDVPSSAVLGTDILVTTTPPKFKDVSMTLMPREDDVTRPIELENKVMVSKKMDDVPIDTSTARTSTAEEEKLAAYQKKMAAYEKDKEIRKTKEPLVIEMKTLSREEQMAAVEQRYGNKDTWQQWLARQPVSLWVASAAVGAGLLYWFTR